MIFEVLGLPQPQGSARAFVNPRTGRPIITSDNKNLKPWRQDVREVAHLCWGGRPAHAGAIWLGLLFRFPRPASHFGAHGLRPSAPASMTVRPDLDKLVRAVQDALRDAGVYRDDAQVTFLDQCFKRYCLEGEAPGVLIEIRPA